VPRFAHNDAALAQIPIYARPELLAEAPNQLWAPYPLLQNASQLHTAAKQTDHRCQPNCAPPPNKLISAAKLTRFAGQRITPNGQPPFDFSLRIDSPVSASLMLL
jgi:hypothetical protein